MLAVLREAGIASLESLAKGVFKDASAGRIGPRQQGRGFNLVERPMGGDVTPRLGDPGGRIGCAGKTHRLGQGLVDLARVQPLQRAAVARAGVRGRAVGTMDLDQLAEWGIELKDLSTGLVDFPAMREGRVVYLCWRLGELQIAFWHDIETGFAGRQPLDENSL